MFRSLMAFFSVFLFAFFVLLLIFLFDSKTLAISEVTLAEMKTHDIMIEDLNSKVKDLEQASSSGDYIALPKAQRALKERADEVRENAKYMKSPEIVEVIIQTADVAYNEANYYDLKAAEMPDAVTKNTLAKRKLQLKIDALYFAAEAQKDPTFLNRFKYWFEIRFRVFAESIYKVIITD